MLKPPTLCQQCYPTRKLHLYVLFISIFFSKAYNYIFTKNVPLIYSSFSSYLLERTESITNNNYDITFSCYCLKVEFRAFYGTCKGGQIPRVGTCNISCYHFFSYYGISFLLSICNIMCMRRHSHGKSTGSTISTLIWRLISPLSMFGICCMGL